MARRANAVSVRATLVLVACAIAAYVASIGAYLVFAVNPTARDLQQRTAALGSEYRQMNDRFDRLGRAAGEATRLSRAGTLSDSDREQLSRLETELRDMADNSAALQSSLHLTDVSVDMRIQLGDATADESLFAATLREAVEYLLDGDQEAARNRLSDPTRLREAMANAVSRAQGTTLTEMVLREGRYAAETQRFSQAVTMWALAGGLLLAAITLVLRRRLYVPLAVLDAGLAKVTDGDLQVSLPVQRDDEFGRVTGQFNQMTELLRIRQSEGETRETRLANRFGRIFEHSFNEIYMFEATSLRLAQMNQGGLEKLGYEASQIEGLTVLDVLGDFDETRFRDLVRSLERDEQPGIFFTTNHVRKNGSRYPVDITLQLWKSETPAMFVAIAQDVAEQRKAETIRVAAQRIAEIALTAPTIEQMFAEIHKVIGGLMPAKNFYVALYDAENDLIRFPYYVDEEDAAGAPPPKTPGRGCTEFVLRTGTPLLLRPELFQDLADRGEVELIGPAAADWLGVPLLTEGRATGVLVVQSYGTDPRHTEADLGILQFVSSQVNMAVMRRHAEATIAESRQNLQSILDAAPFGAMYYRLEPDGRLVFTGANESADRILRVQCAAFVGRTLEENFPALIKTGVPDAYRRAAAEGEPWDSDQVDYDENGITGAFEVHAIRTSPGHMATFFRDITERKRAEMALKRERDLVERIMETSPVGIMLLRPDGTVSFANPAATRILSLTKEEIIGPRSSTTDWRISTISGDPIPRHELPSARVVASRATLFDQEYAIEAADGHRVLIAWSGAPIIDVRDEVEAVVVTIEDVTDQMLLQQALKRSEEQYRSLVEGARDLIVSLTPDGLLSTINPAFEGATGFRREEWLGRPLAELVHPDDAAQVRDLVHRVRTQGSADDTELQLRVSTFAGTYRIGELHITALLREKELVGILCVIRDVTDRVHLEEEVRHAQKMESIGRLAGGVAHDFNNLLTVMLGFATAAKGTLDDDHPAQSDLKEVEQAGEKAAALTRQLLAFARRQVTAPKPLDLNAVTTGMDKMLRRLIGEHLQLDVKPGDGLWTVSADPGHIEQVVMNLAVNARDAMPSGGSITIETANVTVAEHRFVGGADLPAGDYVMVSVTDTGAGFSPEVQAHLFEPFFTTKEKGRGTGLGLATCYGIVTQAGGAIWASSVPGHGATFTFCLPRVFAESRPTEAAERTLQVNGHERILLVEDDDAVRRVALRALTQRGYTVTEAANGRDALAIAEDRTREFEIVVTDVVMPMMGGYELAQRLAVLRPEVKVLFTSGYAEEGIVAEGVLKEAVAFLAKPYDLIALARKVRDVLDS